MVVQVEEEVEVVGVVEGEVVGAPGLGMDLDMEKAKEEGQDMVG